VGQKNKLTYRWARKGIRPQATHDQRTQSSWVFGAVCPERGTGAALVLPDCNSGAMQLNSMSGLTVPSMRKPIMMPALSCAISGSHALERSATASRKPAAQSEAIISSSGPTMKIGSKSSGSESRQVTIHG
jgi:hypothetical protein